MLNLNVQQAWEHFHPPNLVTRQILSFLFQSEKSYTIFSKLKMQCPSKVQPNPPTLNHKLSTLIQMPIECCNLQNRKTNFISTYPNFYKMPNPYAHKNVGKF